MSALGYLGRDPESDRVAKDGEAALIPETTVISDLIEELRLERTSFGIFRDDNIQKDGRSEANELVGFFFLKGNVRLSFDGEDPIVASKSDYVLVGRNTRYALQKVPDKGPCAMGRVAFQLGNSPARLLFRLLPKVMFIRAMSDEELAWHTELERLIANQPPSAQAVSASINRRMIEASLIGLIQTWLDRDQSITNRFNSPDIAWIYPALRALHQSPEKRWTVENLAQLCGMSRSSFAARFANATGETPSRYLTILRLDKARDLLRTSRLPMSDISQRAGYGSDMAFIRAFKRRFGTTPGRMRITAQATGV